MKSSIWSVLSLLILACYLPACKHSQAAVQEKEEATVPLATLSPPEGNTTFMGGTSWCVALPGVSHTDLQIALDWACGTGSADCTAIQAGGACFEPDTLLSHASYAFNCYYQQNGNNQVACNFGGTATLTNHDPSYGKCVYAASGPVKSAAPRQFTYIRNIITSILPLLYLTSRLLA